VVAPKDLKTNSTAPNPHSADARAIAEWANRMAGLLDQPNLDAKLRVEIEARVARVLKSLPKWRGAAVREQVARVIGVAAANLAAGHGSVPWWTDYTLDAIRTILADRAAPPSTHNRLKASTMRAALAAYQRGRGAPSKASGARSSGGAAAATHSVFVELGIDDNTTVSATAKLLKRKVPIGRMRSATADWLSAPRK